VTPRPLRSSLLLLALAPALALAADGAGSAKKLTLVFNGDNGGEIAPCG